MADKNLVSITFPGLPDRYVVPDYSQDIQSLAGGKVDKETGKGLSANDYTTAEKAKLAGIEAGANRTVVDDTLSAVSENPLQNRVVAAALAGIAVITNAEIETLF